MIKIVKKNINYFFHGFILDEKNGIEKKEIIISDKNGNNNIHGEGNMIRVKSVASIHNNDTSHTHTFTHTHTDNNNHNNNNLQINNNNNNNNNTDNYNNDKNINNNTIKTGNDSSKNRSTPNGSPKLMNPLVYNTYTTSISTSSTSFPPYSSSTWPSSHTHSVMACFSHASSLDAFIISAVIPVWNHALVST